MRREDVETGSWCQERLGSPAEREGHITTSRTANEILQVTDRLLFNSESGEVNGGTGSEEVS